MNYNYFIDSILPVIKEILAVDTDTKIIIFTHGGLIRKIWKEGSYL
jgi:broad specificity phosphatase PhoE